MEHVEGKPIRVAIFIDGSNFYHSVRDTFSDTVYTVHDNVDFGAKGFEMLSKILLKERMLITVYYYNAPLDRSHDPDIYAKQQRFFAEVNRLPGFKLVLCRLAKNSAGEYRVKEDDIKIAVDMVSMAYEDVYDVAILVSGDGDFVPVIKQVQKLGKGVENAFFSITSSSYLRHVCNESICLDGFVEEIMDKIKAERTKKAEK